MRQSATRKIEKVAPAQSAQSSAQRERIVPLENGTHRDTP